MGLWEKIFSPSKNNAAPEPAVELKPQSPAAPHLSAANDGQSRTASPLCESCKSTRRLRLWLDAPQADQYLCQDCVHAKGLDNADGDTPLPSVMPQLIAMTEIRDAPGKGAAAFLAASDASKRDRPVEAVEKYLAAIETGLTPAFDAVARNYVGGMFLKQAHIQAALLQLRRALFASPQAPETVHLAAIRFSIVSEELGATAQAKKAAQIAKLAAARMAAPPPQEPVEYIRQAVREHRSKKATPPTAPTALAELNRTLKQLEVKLQQEDAPALPIITLRVGEASGQTVIRWHYVTGYGATSVLLDSDAATQWLTKELSPFGVKIVKRGFTDGSRERGSPERCFVWSVEMQKTENP